MSTELIDLIKMSGFSTVGHFDPAQLVVHPEVRAMCAADRCHAFGKSWSCPPACGSIEEYQALFKRYHTGYLFQTIATMEDSFDYDGIERGSNEHARRLNDLANRAHRVKASLNRDILILGAGSCTLCEVCTYPDAPCRYPQKVFPSMEATGLIVNDVCELSAVPYYHGPHTIAFCSCALE
jgi:predicted metal-binding protein